MLCQFMTAASEAERKGVSLWQTETVGDQMGDARASAPAESKEVVNSLAEALSKGFAEPNMPAMPRNATEQPAA